MQRVERIKWCSDFPVVLVKTGRVFPFLSWKSRINLFLSMDQTNKKHSILPSFGPNPVAADFRAQVKTAKQLIDWFWVTIYFIGS